VKIPEGDRLTCRDLILTAKIVCLIFLAFEMEVKYKLLASSSKRCRLSSFTHPHFVPNLYDFLCPVGTQKSSNRG